MVSFLRSGLLTIAVASLSLVHADEKVRLRTLLLTGTHPPGVPAGVVYEAFIHLDFSRKGALTFRAALAGPGVTHENDAANFVGDASGVLLLARDDDPAAGLPGLVHQGQCYICSIGPIPGPGIDGARGTVFRTLLEAGTAFQGEGVFVSDELGLVSPVLVTGDLAPGAPQFSTLQFLGVPVINSRGDIALGVRLRNDLLLGHGAIYAGSPGNLRLVAEEGDPVPGLPGIQLGVPQLVPEISRTGRVAFMAWLPVGATATTGLFSDRSGVLELLLRTGDPLPTEPGRTLGSFTAPAMDREGRLTTLAFATSFQTIITERDGTWSSVARQGDAPRALPADTYTRLFQPLVNGNGELALQAYLNAAGPSGDDDQVILIDTPLRQVVLARSGQQAADLPPGIVYDALRPVAMNDPGQVVFQASLSGPGVDNSNASALYMSNRRGKPRLVARAGDSIEVRPGDVRTIQFPGAFTFGSTRPLSLNQRGKLAFIVTFVGGDTAVLGATIREKVARARIR
jgi:hypothetical protein